MARPTSYKEEYPELMLKFFSVDCVTYAARGDKRVTKFPTFERFAVLIGVHHQTLLNWCDANPLFLEAYKQCKEIQKDLLIEGGLAGHYNSAFAMFLAKNVTDLKDSVDHSHNHNPIQLSFNKDAN
jgi:hypothetical protein